MEQESPIKPAYEITWVRNQSGSSSQTPSIINDTKTYTASKTMKPNENAVVMTDKEIAKRCKADKETAKHYKYYDEVQKEEEEEEREVVKMQILSLTHEKEAPERNKSALKEWADWYKDGNGNEPTALANSKTTERDSLYERFPMLDFDASDCLKIMIERKNNSVPVSFLNRLNDILLNIKKMAEQGSRGLYYVSIPFSYFAWTHRQLCTSEEKEVRYIMNELEKRGFKATVLSCPRRVEEQDSNICLGIDW